MASSIPIVVIAGGVFIYWYNFGWTLNFYPSGSLYLSALFMVLGLFMLLRHRE